MRNVKCDYFPALNPDSVPGVVILHAEFYILHLKF
jgi:hypothetical protein